MQKYLNNRVVSLLAIVDKIALITKKYSKNLQQTFQQNKINTDFYLSKILFYKLFYKNLVNAKKNSKVFLLLDLSKLKKNCS